MNTKNLNPKNLSQGEEIEDAINKIVKQWNASGHDAFNIDSNRLNTNDRNGAKKSWKKYSSKTSSSNVCGMKIKLDSESS